MDVEKLKPSYYMVGDKYSCLEVIQEVTQDMCGSLAFNMGNVIKYLVRWKNKNGKEDLIKALTYLDSIDVNTVISNLRVKNENNYYFLFDDMYYKMIDHEPGLMYVVRIVYFAIQMNYFEVVSNIAELKKYIGGKINEIED